MYVCIVADPSEMKSPVFNTMIEPVREYVADDNKEHAAEIASMESAHLLRLITEENITVLWELCATRAKFFRSLEVCTQIISKTSTAICADMTGRKSP